MELDLEQN